MHDERPDERLEAWDDERGWDEPTPPMTPGEVGPTAPPVWPTVFGVLSIVLGVLGVVGGLFAIAAAVVLPKIMPVQGANVQLTGPILIVSLTSSGINMLVALLLLVAGVGLLRRRRWSIGATRTWAIIKIVLSLVGSVLGLWMQSTMQQQQAAGATPPPLTQGTLVVIQAVSLVIGLAWAMAWPIVCLVWLSRGSARAEYDRWT